MVLTQEGMPSGFAGHTLVRASWPGGIDLRPLPAGDIVRGSAGRSLPGPERPPGRADLRLRARRETQPPSLVDGCHELTDLQDAGAVENFDGVGRIRELTGQILSREMQLLMHACPPLGAVRHVVDDTLASDVHPTSRLAIMSPQLGKRDQLLTHGHRRHAPIPRPISPRAANSETKAARETAPSRS